MIYKLNVNYLNKIFQLWSFLRFWQGTTLIGWYVFSLFFITCIWWSLKDLDAEGCKRRASREDPSLRLTELIVLSAGVAVLTAVGLALVRAGSSAGGTKACLIGLGAVSVALSWTWVHSVFALRYARTYYLRPVGDIDFN